MFLFFLFISPAIALNCQIGNLKYLTTSENIAQKHHCTIGDLNLPLYIEFERYIGKTEDKNANMAFTFVGSKQIVIQFGMNQVLTNGHLLVLPTKSSLENSLWLYIDEDLSIMFRPKGYTRFISLVRGTGTVLESIEIDASTETGMMQRIVQMTNILPPQTVSHSIEHLEQRVIDFEKEQYKMNTVIVELKSKYVYLHIQNDELRTLTLRLKSSTNVQYDNMYTMATSCVLLTVIFGCVSVFNIFVNHRKDKII